ncbi:non-ribosomal peptide synthetase [Roseateles sp.]|uniref:non-ribosomal peptide synthetase n=1 Tax=Roseateles sp. TaxID=1971397 RepID=UPI003918BB40
MAAPDPGPDTPELSLPLSLSQHEVWLDQRLWPDSGHLHIGGCCHPEGPLDLDCLQRALELMVAESEALRLLPERGGRQRLLPRVRPPLQHIALPAQGDAEAFIERWWLEERQQRFELGRELPWRLSLLSDGRQRHALYLRFHHLVMDGWGTQRFLQRWTEIYSALLVGRPVPAYEGGAYSEHVRESLAYRDSPAFARDADYWARQWPALLPAAQAPRQRGTAAAGRLPALHLARLRISRLELDPVLQGLQARGHSLFDAAVAALCLYLHRGQGADAVAVGMPSLGRSGARWRATLGMFATVQPLLIRPRPGLSVGQLLGQVHQQVAGGLRHARYPLSETAHRLQLLRSGRDSLLDAMVSLERQSYALSFGDSPLTRASQSFGTEARYPLALTLCEFGDSEAVELVLEAADKHCGAAETALLLRRLWHLMAQLPQNLEAPLERLELLPAAEREALILGLHQDLARLERPQTFVQQFLRQARLAPQATALVWEDETTTPSSHSLSYAQLDAASLHLARQLRGRGLRSCDWVALLLPRSPALLLALLATARAGGAFLILDADSPPERLAELLALSGARLLLCAEPGPLHQGLDRLGLPLWGPWPAERAPAQAEDDLSAPEGPAYMLFTSGSTGRPKGVLMGHDALQRRLAWMARRWSLSPQDRAVQQVQPAFDPALIELLLPLTQGASLALMPPGRHSPQRLTAFMARHQASFCALVPATLQALLEGLREHPVPSLRLACCGGETLPPALSNRFLAQTGARLFNVYGPTEACIFASAWACEPWPEDQALPVGRALDDTRIYVLDSERQVLPFGVCGDIWLAGPTLAQGYLEAEDTARAFRPDPFHPGQRMYLSGDRGWLDTDGQLHFAGRQDRQIKLRGHRIELGEVEAACLTLPGVRQAAVQCLQEGQGPARLHAWLAGSAMRPAAELLAALRSGAGGAGLACRSIVPGALRGRSGIRRRPAGTI